jgi:prepilin-type N-terminal cleavage/methylation domain-containing protein/prepilin-type processing-associated H-X9-DG protein
MRLAYGLRMPSISHIPRAGSPTQRIDRSCSGFTLVELLVVIGIIALLISILMPAVSNARHIAQRTTCLAKLHQVMIGAQMHLMDHRGYFPMAGVLPDIQPEHLDDNNSAKYDYFSYPFGGMQRMLAPITISLATELSAKQAQFVLSNQSVGNAETDPNGFIRNFICPSQGSTDGPNPNQSQIPMLYLATYQTPMFSSTVWYTESQSYIYNEAVLGWDDTNKRLRGQYTQIHQPSQTMFAADGQMGGIYEGRFPYLTGVGMLTLYNMVPNPPVTLADALIGDGKAGDPENFDLKRHYGKINIAFCDCHVETRSITQSDLSKVYLMAP